jgi:hypothetical protein
MIGLIERDHLLRKWFAARKHRGEGIGNGHQGHGITPVCIAWRLAL